ncbi:hypothetical protein [Nonomuraea turkmeniaca]|nr:hypothetical protein [Nonomuraea turkmeniaca]
MIRVSGRTSSGAGPRAVVHLNCAADDPRDLDDDPAPGYPA